MAGRLPEIPPPRGGAFPGLQHVFGGNVAIARASEESGAALLDLTNSLVIERVGRETTKSFAGMQERLNTFRDQAFAENDPTKLDAMIATELPKIQQETIDGFPFQTPEYKQKVEGAVNRARSSLLGHQLAVKRQDANATIDLLQKSFAGDVASLPPEDAMAHEQAVASMREDVGRLVALTPQEQEVAAAHIGRVGALSFVDAQLHADPEGTLKLFTDPARADFLGKDPLLKFLTPEDRGKVVDAAQKQVDASQQHTRELAASDLEIGVNEGKYGKPAIDAAFEKNVITGPTRTRLYLDVDRLAKEHANTVDALSRYRSVLAGDDHYDPLSKADQKQVDEVWKREIGPRIDEAMQVHPPMLENPPAVRAELTAQVIHRIGMVPTQVVTETRGNLFNGTPQEATQAADLMDRIEQSDPSKLRHFGRDAIETGTQIAALERMGNSPQEALRKAEETRTQNPAEREFRKHHYGKAERDLNQRRLDKLNNLHWFSDAKIPDAMRGEFEALVEDMQVRNGGDIAIWQEAAWKTLRTVWGESEINGQLEQMKYAPELFYGNQAGTSWIKDQLVEEVNARARSKYGEVNRREDGTIKDVGFLGELPIPAVGGRPAGFASEYSVPLFEEGNPGEPGYRKGPEIPTLVPTLTPEEIKQMTKDIIPNRKPIPQPILEKAQAFARKRIAAGESPFYASPRTIAPEDIRVQVNSNTARWATLGNPKYSVLVRDKESGEFTPVEGNWYPDFATSQPGMAARAESEAKLQRDREARADVIAQGDPLGPWIDSVTMIPEVRSAVRATARAVKKTYMTQGAVIDQIGRRGGIGPNRLPGMPEPSKAK